MYSPLLQNVGGSDAFLEKTKGMNPQQVQQAAVQAAMTGQLSFGAALAVKQMADQVKPPAQPPQQGNVMSDMIQQIFNPNQPPQQGQPPPQQPQQQQPQQDPRMAAGIATLPAPNVGQHMAGGGIVAFADGGRTTHVEEPTYWEAVKDRLAELAGRNHVGSGAADKAAETIRGRKAYLDSQIDKNSMARGGITSLVAGGPPADGVVMPAGFDPSQPSNPYAFMGLAQQKPPPPAEYYAGMTHTTPSTQVIPPVNQAVTAGPVASAAPPMQDEPDDQSGPQIDLDKLTGYDPSKQPQDYAAGIGIKVGAKGLPKNLQDSLDYFKAQVDKPVRGLQEDINEWKSSMDTLGIGEKTKAAIGHIDELDANALKTKNYERSQANLDGSIAALKQSTLLGGQEGYAGNGLGGNLAVLAKFLETRRGAIQKAEQNYAATKEKLVENRDRLTVAAENNDRDSLKTIASDHKADIRSHDAALRDYATVMVGAMQATMREQAESMRIAAQIRAMKPQDELRPMMLQSAARLSWLASHKPTDPHFDEVKASSDALSKAIQEGRSNQPAGYGINQRDASSELRDFNKNDGVQRLLRVINDGTADKVKRAAAEKQYRAYARQAGVDPDRALGESGVIDASDLPRSR
jgi:hypothetical protein